MLATIDSYIRSHPERGAIVILALGLACSLGTTFGLPAMLASAFLATAGLSAAVASAWPLARAKRRACLLVSAVSWSAYTVHVFL